MLGIGRRVEGVGASAAKTVGDIEARAGAAERKTRLGVRCEMIARPGNGTKDAVGRGVGARGGIAVDAAVAAIGRGPHGPALLERWRTPVARRHGGVGLFRLARELALCCVSIGRIGVRVILFLRETCRATLTGTVTEGAVEHAIDELPYPGNSRLRR